MNSFMILEGLKAMFSGDVNPEWIGGFFAGWLQAFIIFFIFSFGKGDKKC